MPYRSCMPSPGRISAFALALALGIPVAGLTVTTAQAAPPRSGPYVNGTTPLSGGTGSVLDVATLRDDSILVASSLGDGTGVLDIVDNTGDNFMPDDDSMTFLGAVAGVGANQLDDTIYAVTPGRAIPVGNYWTTRASGANRGWQSITWGDDTFVAVAAIGTDRVMTSPDGITWTNRAAASANQWQSVAWGGPAGNELFVAVSNSGVGNRIMTSANGITWTSRASTDDSNWTAVTWGDDTFVAVSNYGPVMTSSDGLTWTRRTSLPGSWSSVTWGGPAGQEKFVAVAGGGVMTSPDGVTWTSRTSPTSNAWTSVTWGGPAGQEKFVAVAYSGTGDRVMTSPDGITWTSRTSATDLLWESVAWGGPAGDGRFVAVARDFTSNAVMTSPDGINWTTQQPASTNSWAAVAWGGPTGGQTFVSLAETGTGDQIMTSAAVPVGLSAIRGTTIADTASLGAGSGGDWAAVAVNSADDTVYVASQDDTRLYALNGANLDDSRGVPLLASLTPRAVAVDQDDDTVYVLSSNIASGTSRITAMRGSNLDDSISVDFGMTTYLQSLAVNQVDGSVYVGGRDDTTSRAQVRVFTPGLIAADAQTIDDVDPVMGLDVSQDGRRLYATTSGGDLYLLNTANLDDSASVALGISDPGGVAIDDFGWAWTASPASMGGSRSLIQIGTAPTFTSITPTSGLPAGGYTATITGSWFTPTTTAAFGVEANLGTTIGTPTSNSMTVTVPPGPAGAADLILTNVAGPSQPLGVNASGTFTYVNPPLPAFPPSPPRDVTAVAGDASATVVWTAPANPGSFPVSNYSVTASPGGKTCLTPTLTCQVTGLTNGMTYTFIVKALNGAGWSAESAPSNAVTPKATAKPSITITGSRDGSSIRVAGTTTELTGSVTPWVKFPGQTGYTQGTARPAITDNAFTWSRKANKKAYVYVTHGAAKSNTVTIAAR